MPKRKATAAPIAPPLPFVYIAAGGYGQHKVPDAPGYKKGAKNKLRTGILITRAKKAGGPLHEVDYHAGPGFGWITYRPPNHVCPGTLYGVSSLGKLHSFSINAQDGSLTEISRVDTLGCSAYVDVHKHATVANYGDGVLASFGAYADGSLSEALDSKLHWHEPEDEALADRQEASHPHQIRVAPSPTNDASGYDEWCTYVMACDLGADKVWVYELSHPKGALIGAANSERHLQMPTGSGPRHLDFHPNGKWVYVLCELSGDIVTCAWDDVNGRLTQTHSVSALPDGVSCCRAHHAGNSHIVVGVRGTRVYALTRTDNMVVAFAVHPRNGSLTFLQRVSTRGLCPRNFDVTPEPPYRLRVYNQDSHSLAEFALDKNGKLPDAPEVLTEFKGVCGQCLCEVAL